MEESVAEGLEDVRGGEVGGGVVTEVFGVAEGEARDVVVVGEPGQERQQGEGQGRDPEEVLAEEIGAAAVAEEQEEL